MLLPQTKEREYRFKLALRMGLPIFALIVAFISATLIERYDSLSPSFYFLAVLLLTFSIYFIFFLIYRGYEVKITDFISGTFTREYLYDYLKKEIQKEDEYTLILLSIDNLADINTLYGINNGDKVIKELIKHTTEYFKDKKIVDYPMGHFKGGSFIMGLKGNKEEYGPILDLFCLKCSELKIDEIEVSISGAVVDTSFSKDLDYLIENIFEEQRENRERKTGRKADNINPSDLERYVIEAIKENSLEIMTQDVFEDESCAFKECFIKLKTFDNGLLHPKSYMKTVNKLGLIREYDLLVIREIITRLVSDDSLAFAVNVSPVSLRNYSFISQLKELLSHNKSASKKIIFILSEVEYHTNIVKFNESLQILRELGVKIAIDRLGSLHTSFLYLRELDIDIVRFDSTYKNGKYTEVVEGYNLLAHKKGVKTWLKMIESEEIKSFADSTGIDYLQGKALAPLNTIDGEE